MQFPWTPWKKTHTKRIRVVYRDCPKSSTEKLVLSYKGVNWELTLYYYRKDGRIMRRRKRHSRISSWRWIKRNSVSLQFVYKGIKINSEFVKVVDEETILKILYHYRGYLESCGMRNFNKLGDVVLSI
jgi:hypothetical protein